MVKTKAEISRDLEKALQKLEQASLPLWGDSPHKRRSDVFPGLSAWNLWRVEVIWESGVVNSMGKMVSIGGKSISHPKHGISLHTNRQSDTCRYKIEIFYTESRYGK